MQRQYTGTAGRIENAQVAVYLGYAAPAGHALIDRELYLPRSWTDDPDRCAAAGIPDGRGVRDQAGAGQADDRRGLLAAGGAGAWVAGDEVYGGQRAAADRAGSPAHRLRAGGGLRSPGTRPGPGATLRADHLAARLPKRAWQRLSAGHGAKGHRWYDWAWSTIAHTGSGCRYLLIRRNRSTGELAYYRCCSPQPVTLAALVTVAGLGGPWKRISSPARA